MPYLALRQRYCVKSRPIAVLVALCLLIAPVLSMAMDVHELAHEAQGIAHVDHEHPGHHDGHDRDGDESPGGLHAVLHSVHVCGHGMGIPPSLTPPVLANAAVPVVLQSDTLQFSAVPNLLFRPPRKD